MLSNDETERQTDGRTLDIFIDPAPRTMRAVSKIYYSISSPTVDDEKFAKFEHVVQSNCPIHTADADATKLNSVFCLVGIGDINEA